MPHLQIYAVYNRVILFIDVVTPYEILYSFLFQLVHDLVIPSRSNFALNSISEIK